MFLALALSTLFTLVYGAAARLRRAEKVLVPILDILQSIPKLFAEKARERAPLVRAIRKALEATKDGNLGEGFFLDLLRRGFSEDEARQQLKIAVDWGRYGELFDFDADTGQLTLEHAHAPGLN
jgi:hypothetical protein